MGIEIERKFLVHDAQLPTLENGRYISQGYIETKDHTVVRARIKDEAGYLTIKSKSIGIRCAEFEYEIPVDDAQEIITTLCNGKSVEKTRYEILVGAHTWEIDCFHGDNDGLIIAEVELGEEGEDIEIPPWVSREVSGELKYFNANLLNKPYKHW